MTSKGTVIGNGVSMVMSGSTRRVTFRDGQMGKITIDDKTYEGRELVSDSNGIRIDGKPIEAAEDKKYKVTSIIIQGPMHGDVTASEGDIEIQGDVHGRVMNTNGKISVGKTITGDANNVNGNIVAHEIRGSAHSVNGNVNRDFQRR